MQRTARIRTLNEDLRTNFVGGQIALTPGVLALGDVPTILKQLQNFSSFDRNGDPKSERNFGAFRYEGSPYISGNGPLIYFQINYYDPALMLRSSNPAEAALTARVLTLMLAEEY